MLKAELTKPATPALSAPRLAIRPLKGVAADDQVLRTELIDHCHLGLAQYGLTIGRTLLPRLPTLGRVRKIERFIHRNSSCTSGQCLVPENAHHCSC
jgi:hypothetical protein